MQRFPSLLTTLAAGLLLSSLPAAADSVNIYVGYADNLRPSGFFPTPWLGDPNVVSQTPPSESFDSGAVRIDNTGTTPVTITNFSVTLNPGAGPILFNFWTPLTIAPGQTGIFTQSASYNFDSSDSGIFGGGPLNIDPSHPLGGCTNPADASQAALCAANQPIVSFDENGTLVTTSDSAHILDTFGYDFIHGSTDGNESINWNLIGTGVIRGGGGTGTPEPATIVFMGSGLAILGLAVRRRAAK